MKLETLSDPYCTADSGLAGAGNGLSFALKSLHNAVAACSVGHAHTA
jgi:hypothetical protein